MVTELTIRFPGEVGELVLEKFFSEGGAMAEARGKLLLAEIAENLLQRYLVDDELKLLDWEPDDL